MREGDFEGLLAVLDPDVVLRVDGGVLRGSREVRTAEKVAGEAILFRRVAARARPALVNGAAGFVQLERSGRPFAVVGFTVTDGKIVEIDILADPDRLAELDLDLA